MTQSIVELARIRLKPGVTEAQLLEASRMFQRDFLDAQPGFISRELLRLDEGSYFDLVRWQSAEHAAAIVDRIAGSEACGAYFAVMEMGTGDIMEGVRHYTALASYGRT